MPEIMRWIYRMFLLNRGTVVEHSVEFGLNYAGHTEKYEIIGCSNGHTSITLKFTIDMRTGQMDGRMEQSRDVVPVYEIGSAEPVEYLSKINWKNIGYDQEGRRYKKIV